MQFSAVVGHKELKRHLVDEVRSQKIGHTQLFVGKPGYGPLPLALAFIQFLFCENKDENDSCGTCPSCRKVSLLQHPDVHFSYPTVQSITNIADGAIGHWREQIEENAYFDLNTWVRKIDPKERKPILGKDESQEIIKKLSLRSFEGGYKVMLIWMIEEMNASCSNKLLKILEEPPDKTIFILIAESIEQIIPTILSRSQTVVVPRISVDDISIFLRMNYQLNNDNAVAVASRSDGDILDAIEQATHSAEGERFHKQFVQLMRVCYRKNVLDMLTWSEDVGAESKEHQKQFLRYGLHMIRQSMLKNYTEDQLTRVSKEEDQFLDNFARFITGNNVLDFTKLFSDSVYHIERNANGKILFTNLCFQVMRFIHAA